MKQDEFIDPQIREQISTKVDEVKEHIDYYAERKRLIGEGLRAIGDVHSFWIENPELRSSGNIVETNPSTLAAKSSATGMSTVISGSFPCFLANSAKEYALFTSVSIDPK